MQKGEGFLGEGAGRARSIRGFIKAIINREGEKSLLPTLGEENSKQTKIQQDEDSHLRLPATERRKVQEHSSTCLTFRCLDKYIF